MPTFPQIPIACTSAFEKPIRLPIVPEKLARDTRQAKGTDGEEE